MTLQTIFLDRVKAPGIGHFLDRCSKHWKMVLIVLLTGTAASSANDTAILQDLVGQWVELRGQIAEERRAGTAATATLEHERTLLQAEKKRLELALKQERARTNAQRAKQHSAEVELSRLLNEQKELEEALGAAHPLSEGSIPAALAFDQLIGGRTPHETLNNALTYFTKLEQLQCSTHQVHELHPTPQGVREVSVIYLGLSAGFAVTDDASWAAVGLLDQQGDWQWTERNDLAKQLLAASAHTNETQLPLLPLSLEVQP